MDKNKILAGFKRFLKGLLFGIVLIVVVVMAVNWLFFGDNEAKQQISQEQIEIAVSSQTVKLVSGKYRYFFDIRNNDSQPFSGDVNIAVINAEGDSVYGKTFSSNQPIASGLGTSVYFDINTGLNSTHGSYGVQSYSYTAKVRGEVVKTGVGTIQPLSQ